MNRFLICSLLLGCSSPSFEIGQAALEDATQDVAEETRAQDVSPDTASEARSDAGEAEDGPRDALSGLDTPLDPLDVATETREDSAPADVAQDAVSVGVFSLPTSGELVCGMSAASTQIESSSSGTSVTIVVDVKVTDACDLTKIEALFDSISFGVQGNAFASGETKRLTFVKAISTAPGLHEVEIRLMNHLSKARCSIDACSTDGSARVVSGKVTIE